MANELDGTTFEGRELTVRLVPETKVTTNTRNFGQAGISAKAANIVSTPQNTRTKRPRITLRNA